MFAQTICSFGLRSTLALGLWLATLLDSTALVLSEIHYQPEPGNDFEFLELFNDGENELDLSGAFFSQGIEYSFGNFQLASGAYAVIAKNRAAFIRLYGNIPEMVSGDFDGSLRNEGEQLVLLDRLGRVLIDMTYDTSGNWPLRARGQGSSMELIDSEASLNEASNWRSSREVGGSPGFNGRGDAPWVVVNEILAHTDSPFEDAIELLNVGPDTVDLSGWYLSDDFSELTKYRIPSGTILGAGEYIVFYEQQFLLTNPRTPFSLNSFLGDEVFLTAAHPDGALAAFVDEIAFGPTGNGISYGRFPNGGDEWLLLERVTFGTSVLASDPPALLALFRQGKGSFNAGPKVGPVVISEIRYRTQSELDEFVRLTNVSLQTIPLFDPEHPGNTWELQGGISITMPTGLVLLPGESLLVVGDDPGAFRSRHDDLSAAALIGPFSGRLNNGGESIALFRPDSPQNEPPHVGLVPQLKVDQISYTDDSPWPAVMNDQSIQKVELGDYGNDPSNWRAESGVTQEDDDRDGIPDAWEREHGLDPSNQLDAQSDFDGDGYSALEEYITGSNPNDADSIFRVEWKVVRNEDEGFLTAEWQGRAGRQYKVYVADSLSLTWRVSQAFEVDNEGLVSVVLSSSPKASTEFFRVSVELDD